MTTPRVPDGIEGVSPAEAWLLGHSAGRESMASAMQADAEATAALEGPSSMKLRDERIARAEATATRALADMQDYARAVVDLGRRVKDLEESDRSPRDAAPSGGRA